MILNAALLIGGLLILLGGAELLVRCASKLALRLGVSPMVIGLTVVAFGTSAPEFAVCIGAAWTGQGDIALGNVVGSSIYNVLLILGIAALVAPLVVARPLVRLDLPLMVLASAVVLALGWDGTIGRLDGALLFAALLAYLGLQLHRGRMERAAAREVSVAELEELPVQHPLLLLGLMALGLLLLVGGSEMFVNGATAIARQFGLSELVIGLTIVAIGTSLPEIATSVVAGLRGERDIAVGNVVGSNLFNLLGVLGVTALVAPAGVPVAPQALTFDLPVMLVTAMVCVPVFLSGYAIRRWEGALFLFYAVLYTVWLLLAARGVPWLPQLGWWITWVVFPLTAAALLLLMLRERTTARPSQ